MNVADEEAQMYCIQLHLRRTTHEDAYLSVPVVSEIMDEQPDGTGRINIEAMYALAARLGENEAVEWVVEDTKIEPHPVQGPKPDNRKGFDVHINHNSVPGSR